MATKPKVGASTDKPKRQKTPGSGRTAGTPNKATVAFRETVRQLLENNADNIPVWLTQVAQGVPKLDADGKPVPGQWIVEPDPDKALQRLTGLAEYAAPKLARTELVNDPDNPIAPGGHRNWSDDQLIALIAKLGEKR